MGAIYDESAPHPHENDYASHLNFFIDIVTRLEERAMKARKLVEERSRGLLGRVFSRVFSNLLSRDSHFDFNVVLAPVPAATQDRLARWVDDHVDALVEEFAPEDDTVVLAVGVDGIGGDDEGNGRDDTGSAGGADGGDEEGTLS